MKKTILILSLLILISSFGYFFYSNFQQRQFLFHIPKKTIKEEISKNKVNTKAINNLTALSNNSLNLEIETPQDKAVVSSKTILIKGKTAPLADVFINEKETKSDSQGNFSFNYSLDEGENELIIAANDNNGNYAEKVLTVELKTPN